MSSEHSCSSQRSNNESSSSSEAFAAISRVRGSEAHVSASDCPKLEEFRLEDKRGATKELEDSRIQKKPRTTTDNCRPSLEKYADEKVTADKNAQDKSEGTSASNSENTPLSLATNPYAIYLTNRPGSLPAHPFTNPYYFLAPHPMPMYYSSQISSSSRSSSSSAAKGHSQPQSSTPPDNSNSREPSSKSKRLISTTVQSKSHSIPVIPRDKQGQPMLPLNVGIMTVLRLGTVCPREHFHSERYIYPIGYEVTRRYLSTLSPHSDAVYRCSILDGGDGPKFQITSDALDKPIIASTATGAWSTIVRQANKIRDRQHSNSVSGPEFFGLGQNTIKHLIQQLPGAERLAVKGTGPLGEIENASSEKDRRPNGIYVWQKYIEGGPLGGRHAAVVPALLDDHGGHGLYYPPGSTSKHRSNMSSTESNTSAEPISSPSSSEYTGPGAIQTLSTGLSHYPPHILAQIPQQTRYRQMSHVLSQPPPQSPPDMQLSLVSQPRSSSTRQAPPTLGMTPSTSTPNVTLPCTLSPITSAITASTDPVPSMSQFDSIPLSLDKQTPSACLMQEAHVQARNPHVQATLATLLNSMANKNGNTEGLSILGVEDAFDPAAGGAPGPETGSPLYLPVKLESHQTGGTDSEGRGASIQEAVNM
ncbi:hypothetical protein BDP27DRAFT_1365645 [Rhodocollybia butyracea]|uniref:Transforming growth factor beta regulator 1 n=1 Tax=Rhodocollybia butyracea TaxID=206335 RepID=A0A9P5PIS3_9AGAR|nr:hypothetical protein BDP27DRAFT_1365645 [Rhodocollybia butyracea]